MRYSSKEALQQVQKDQLDAEANKQARAADTELLKKYKTDYYIVRNSRFWIGQGKDAQIIILDRKVDDIEFVREHSFYNTSTKESTYELCVRETDDCPICKAAARDYKGAKNSYFRMGFTVLHVTKDKEGNKVVYKKFMAVKSKEISAFLELMNECEAENGTIRGMTFKVKRPAEDKSPVTGLPVQKGSKIEYTVYTEKQLKQLLDKYQPKAVTKKDKDGNDYVTKPAGWLITPITDYEGIHLNTPLEVLNKKYDPDYVMDSESSFDNDEDLDLDFDEDVQELEDDVKFDSNGDEITSSTDDLEVTEEDLAGEELEELPF